MIDRAAPRAAHTLPTDPVTASTNSQAEYAALIELVEQFTPDDWHRPTDCEGWTPREIVAHLAGAAESAVRWRKFIKHNAIATARAARGPLQLNCRTTGGRPAQLGNPGTAEATDQAGLRPQSSDAGLGRVAAGRDHGNPV